MESERELLLKELRVLRDEAQEMQMRTAEMIQGVEQKEKPVNDTLPKKHPDTN